MTRHLAALATAGALALAVPAAAQTTKHRAPRRAAATAAESRVTLTGCLAAGEQPNGFSLSVMSSDTSAAAAQPGAPTATGTAGTTSATAPSISEGSQVQLIGDTTSLGQLANRKVQITGVVVPQAAARSRSKTAAAATATPTTRVRVQRIERLADSCQGGGTAGTSGMMSAPSPTSTPSATPSPSTPPSEPTPTAAPTPTPSPSTPPSEPSPAAPSTAPSAARESGVSSESLTSGLSSANVQQIVASATAQSIVSAADVLEASQVDALTQAISSNSTAMKNAQELTSALQSRGLLQSNERVVGVSGNTIYKASQK